MKTSKNFLQAKNLQYRDQLTKPKRFYQLFHPNVQKQSLVTIVPSILANRIYPENCLHVWRHFHKRFNVAIVMLIPVQKFLLIKVFIECLQMQILLRKMRKYFARQRIQMQLLWRIMNLMIVKIQFLAGNILVELMECIEFSPDFCGDGKKKVVLNMILDCVLGTPVLQP